jgi:hypothetical protein
MSFVALSTVAPPMLMRVVQPLTDGSHDGARVAGDDLVQRARAIGAFGDDRPMRDREAIAMVCWR